MTMVGMPAWWRARRAARQAACAAADAAEAAFIADFAPLVERFDWFANGLDVAAIGSRWTNLLPLYLYPLSPDSVLTWWQAELDGALGLGPDGDEAIEVAPRTPLVLIGRAWVAPMGNWEPLHILEAVRGPNAGVRSWVGEGDGGWRSCPTTIPRRAIGAPRRSA